MFTPVSNHSWKHHDVDSQSSLRSCRSFEVYKKIYILCGCTLSSIFKYVKRCERIVAEYKAEINQGLQRFTYQEVNRSNHWTRSGSRPAHHPACDFPAKSSSLRYQSARPARLMQAPISRLGRRRQVFLKSLGVASEKVRTVSPDCPALPSPRRSPPGCCELSRGYSRGAYLLWKTRPSITH